ncbi:MAG: bifunctional nuclease family protein [Candidatus Zixiibacteriota bacterium]|nr:MAG: bifunctional nuclease family protein [candidate division Zixibacteria bacterium]
MALLAVKVDGLALDLLTNSPVVILSHPESDKQLPIWIGPAEAGAIAMELSNIESKRPMTHDILKTIISVLSAKVEKIAVTELKEQTYYARIWLKCNGVVHEIDARPSDSIALALKIKAPIFAEESLFTSSVPDMPAEMKADSESLADRLKRINPEDFGKYSL